MEIPKDKILELLRQRGDNHKAEQADRELPDRVDPERDKGILDQESHTRSGLNWSCQTGDSSWTMSSSARCGRFRRIRCRVA
jgi:hypothetical protein